MHQISRCQNRTFLVCIVNAATVWIPASLSFFTSVCGKVISIFEHEQEFWDRQFEERTALIPLDVKVSMSSQGHSSWSICSWCSWIKAAIFNGDVCSWNLRWWCGRTTDFKRISVWVWRRVAIVTAPSADWLANHSTPQRPRGPSAHAMDNGDWTWNVRSCFKKKRETHHHQPSSSQQAFTF